MTPILTREDEVDAHVGAVVTLEGTVANSKIPTLLGVAVDGDEVRGKPARATGTLRRTVVTSEEIADRVARSGQFANRGAGTFYSLEAISGSGLARATPLS